MYNYDENANYDDGSCLYNLYDPDAINYGAFSENFYIVNI